MPVSSISSSSPVLHFVKKCAILAFPVLILMGLSRYATESIRHAVYGPSLRERMVRAFDLAAQGRYEWLVLGNSRMYRGVNPTFFPRPGFNLSQDDDGFNHAYYKLRYLEERGIQPRIVILGIDYFQFSALSETRLRFYKSYLGASFLADYSTNTSSIARVFDEVFTPSLNTDANEFASVFFSQTPLSLVKWGAARLRGQPMERRYVLKDNGQYSVDVELAFEGDFIKRKIIRLPIQEEYFRRVIQWSAERRIPVVLVMPPVRDIELASYDDASVDQFERFLKPFINNHSVFYLNYARDKRFSIREFGDVTHLNPAGADKFSEILSGDLKKLLNRN